MKTEKSRKKDEKKIQLNRIEKRLDEIEDCVNLGTFDNSILAMMIFLFALALGLLSLDVFNVVKNIPSIFIFAAYFILGSVLLVGLIFNYFLSIIQKNNRFGRKIFTLTFLQGNGFFVAIIFITSIILNLIEKNIQISPKLVTWIVVIEFVAIILYSIFKLRKDNKKYFEANFPFFIKRRMKEIKKGKKKK